MPPPATPAQQRFLPGSRRHKTSVKPPERGQDAAPRTIDNVLRGDAQDQFNIAPRFSRPSTQPRSTLRPAVQDQATPSKPDKEAIHDRTQSETGEDDEMLLETLKDHEAGWTGALPLSPKRRRLSGPEHYPDLKPASTARMFTTGAAVSRHTADASSTAPRFRSIPASSQRTSHAPSFAMAAVPDQSYHSPLPDAFSPQRRGDHYMPGGLAATLQQWVLETGQAAMHTRKMPQDVFVMKLTIKHILLENDKLTLLEAMTEDERLIKVSLIDSTSGDRTSKPGIHVGSTIGLREPCWPMTTSTDHWIVCVQWRILHTVQ